VALVPDGVLPRQDLQRLIAEGAITSARTIDQAHIQPASLDLTLGAVAHRLRCSFLPGDEPVATKLRDYEMGAVDLQGGAVLEQNRPYLIPLNETLALPPELRGRANPRSSTGRVDVFTRLLTDYGNHFDEVAKGYQGRLYLEVVPRSFTIKVTEGLRLNQLRLMTDKAQLSDRELIELSRAEPLVFPGSASDPNETVRVADGLFLSVDLSGGGRRFAGYKAKKSSALLDLTTTGHQVADYWERVTPKDGRLILDQEEFYLLVSKERVRIPPDYAAEMAAYDPTSGELRTHYAGFFDPGFGDVSAANEAPGTPAVLEVRAHDVPFALEHGQRLCKLTFERMTARPDLVYGAGIGSRYQRQYLALGRQFRSDQLGIPKPRTSGGDRPLQLVAQFDADETTRPLSVDFRE
jgi:dCTP deaminase